jgi:RNA polymerase sigma-70 factor (ECF subfamily)
VRSKDTHEGRAFDHARAMLGVVPFLILPFEVPVPDPLATVAPAKLAKPLGVAAGADAARADAEARADAAEREVSALFHASAGEVHHYALLVSRDEALAQDALQEAFMRYFIARSRGQRIAHPRAWIYRVVCNYVLDRMKQSQIHATHRMKDAAALSDENQDIEARCYRQQVLRLIGQTLTTRELEVVRLRSAGFQYQEIASALHLRSGTVGALISRAVKKMRALMAGVARSGR